MNTVSPKAEVREALSSVQQYLSDAIAPLLVAQSVALLLDHPIDLMAAEIANWVTGQYQVKGRTASVPEYFFHALKKLHDMGQFKLVPMAPLAEYLKNLKKILLEYCPVEDRQSLLAQMSRLGEGETALSPAVTFLHRTVDPEEAPAVSEHSVAYQTNTGSRRETAEARRDRRLSILMTRLAEEKPSEPSSPGEMENKRGELVSEVVATAAAGTQSGKEFRKLQENLKQLGIPAETQHIFRTLSNSLPGWAVPVTLEAGESSTRQNTVVEAMRQIMQLSEDRWEGTKRFQEMVQTAIEQFNTGSLAKAATMLDLADSLISGCKLNPETVASTRGTAHDSLDSKRLRSFAEKAETHHLLQRVMNFFLELRPKGLLESLRREQKRDRRSLILSLLEAHGAAARTAAFEQLAELSRRPNLRSEWFYPRNLLCLLHRNPRPDDMPPEREIDMLACFLKLSLPAPLIRETLTCLGQIKHHKSEQMLIAVIEELESHLLRQGTAHSDPTRLKSLLDRAIFTLAHYGTPNAYRRVVAHALNPNEESEDVLGRISYLSGQDLSADEESVQRLIAALKSKLPLRVLGIVRQKNVQVLLHLIRALSSTASPAVQQVFETIAARFPDQEFGKAASKAIKEMVPESKQREAVTERLLGDLELLGLPDLLQQLARSQLTGTLIIKDRKGEPAGAITLQRGRLQSANAGRIEDKEAVYRLLERPVGGTFSFLGRKDPAEKTSSDLSHLMDLTEIVAEGLRRHDELRHALALVPDSVPLRPTGVEPVPHAEDDNSAFIHQIWKKASSGVAPEECEAEYPADTYRVRCLLARWVEEGVLSVS